MDYEVWEEIVKIKELKKEQLEYLEKEFGENYWERHSAKYLLMMLDDDNDDNVEK